MGGRKTGLPFLLKKFCGHFPGFVSENEQFENSLKKKKKIE
jgi:hypothetical protein